MKKEERRIMSEDELINGAGLIGIDMEDRYGKHASPIICRKRRNGLWSPGCVDSILYILLFRLMRCRRGVGEKSAYACVLYGVAGCGYELFTSTSCLRLICSDARMWVDRFFVDATFRLFLQIVGKTTQTTFF